MNQSTEQQVKEIAREELVMNKREPYEYQFLALLGKAIKKHQESKKGDKPE